jgi:hypothetical protein
MFPVLIFLFRVVFVPYVDKCITGDSAFLAPYVAANIGNWKVNIGQLKNFPILLFNMKKFRVGVLSLHHGQQQWQKGQDGRDSLQNDKTNKKC